MDTPNHSYDHTFSASDIEQLLVMGWRRSIVVSRGRTYELERARGYYWNEGKFAAEVIRPFQKWGQTFYSDPVSLTHEEKRRAADALHRVVETIAQNPENGLTYNVSD